MGRLLMVVMFAGLALGSVLLFREIDSTSHSVSDTIRPFVITIGPLWLAAAVAARLVLRGGRV